MTRDDIDRAWSEFLATFESGRGLETEPRVKAALRAAFRALAPDQILEERGRKIVEAVAAKHGTTAEAIRSWSWLPDVIAAGDEAAFELARSGLAHRAIARLLGRKTAAKVRKRIGRHEARIAIEAAQRLEVSHG